MKGVVTNRQIFFILLFTLTSVSLISMPREAVKAAGTGAWFAILIVTAIFALGIFFIASLNNKFEGKTIYEYSNILVGKTAAKVIGLFYTINFLFVVIILLRIIAEFIKASALPLTPVSAILVLFITVPLYISYKGITNIGRMCEIYGVIFIVVSLSAHTAQYFLGDINYIQPFFEPKQIKEYIFGAKDLFGAFLGIEVLTIIPFGKVNNKKGILYSVIGVLYVGLFYIIATEASVMIVGINDIINYNASLVEALRETKLPSTVLLERTDILFLTVGTIGILSGLCILFFTSVENASRLLPSVSRNIWILVIGIIAYISSTFLVEAEMANFLFRFVIPVFGIFTAFIIPIILFAIAKVKKYENQNL